MLYEIIYESTSKNITETLWAKLPSFYVDDKVVRFIPFKNHINIQAEAVILHKDELSEYKITPKGILQVFHNQQIPSTLLKVIFKETLERKTI